MPEMKLERAKELLEELKSLLIPFLSSNPYTILSELEAGTNRRTYFVSEAKSLPEKVPLIIGEILQNLRTALDHFAFKEFLKENPNPTEEQARGVYFLIPQNNKILKQLHDLNRIDKHRMIITAGAAYSVDLMPHMLSAMPEALREGFAGMGLFVKPADDGKTFPVESGTVLFYDTPNASEIPMKFKFELCIHEPGIADNENVAAFIEAAIIEVDKQIA